MAIVLPTKKSVAIKNPKKLLLYGKTKVGKSEAVSQLENSLIIDTERGTSYVEALSVQATGLRTLREILDLLKEKNSYDAIVIDTIDNVVEWTEKAICELHDVETIGDLEYGKGYALVREKILNVINEFAAVTDKLIIIGHLKKTIIGNESVEVNTSSLDLTGKLKNMIFADMDAIGLMYRSEDELKVSFKPSDEIEAGSRCIHLRGQIFNFDWKKIYV